MSGRTCLGTLPNGRRQPTSVRRLGKSEGAKRCMLLPTRPLRAGQGTASEPGCPRGNGLFRAVQADPRKTGRLRHITGGGACWGIETRSGRAWYAGNSNDRIPWSIRGTAGEADLPQGVSNEAYSWGGPKAHGLSVEASSSSSAWRLQRWRHLGEERARRLVHI